MLRENRDPMHPLVANLPHYVRLYTQCRHELEKRHASLGVLRANDLGLGASCMAEAVSRRA